jgi:cobalamin-dependent methionine synthase I
LNLGDAEGLSLLAVTLGSGVDVLLNELQASKDTLGAFIADAVASVLVETLVRELDEERRNRAAKFGLVGSRRRSPGYPGFPLELNRDILDRLDAGKLGMSCGPGGELRPRKTVCALIGWRSAQVNPRSAPAETVLDGAVE